MELSTYGIEAQTTSREKVFYEQKAKPKGSPTIYPWPKPLAPEAFHGLAGEITRFIEPHSESDPAAILIQLLAAMGNCFGRTAHFIAQGVKHYPILFAVLVGNTARSRKGSSWGPLEILLKKTEPGWATENITSGLSSGEGLIWHVRDEIRDGNGEVLDAGVREKRLLLIEEEFASVLKVSSREGNIVSAIIRKVWDGKVLRSLTKNSPLKSTDAHISVIGHITRDELKRYLSQTESMNGFGNRFQYYCVKRSKLLPDGGSFHESDVTSVVEKLRKAVSFSQNCGLIKKSEDATRLWKSVYEEMTEGFPGVLGAITARREAHAMRNACVYALLDLSDVVRPEHLTAAIALDEYQMASCRHIFGDGIGNRDASMILDALKQSPHGLTRTEINHDVFHRNRTSVEIEEALGVLAVGCLAFFKPEKGGGRDVERWFAN